MSDLKLSIIVPVYNVEAYIGQCLKSIREQTYRNLEIIVVDDGSEDATGKLCDEFAAADARIRVIHQPNQGTMKAREAGIDAASGELLAFVDGDDWVEPDMFKKLVEKMGEADLIISAGFIETQAGCVGKQPCLFDEGIYCGESLGWLMRNFIYDFNRAIELPCWGVLWGNIYRAELMRRIQIKSAPNHRIEHGEDALLLLQYILECKSIFITNEVFYHYLFREESAWHKPSPESLIDFIYIYTTLKAAFEQRNEENEKYNLVQQLRQWIARVLHQRLTMDICTNPETRCIENILDTSGFRGKRIVLFGAGGCGQDYYRQLCAFHMPPAAWLDSRPRTVFGRQVENIDSIVDMEYDLVLLAVSFSSTAEEMREQLLRLGVPEKKIRWQEPLTIYPRAVAEPPAAPVL